MAIPPPPTSYLPPIAKIASYTSTQLLDALAYLKLLYNLEVHASCLATGYMLNVSAAGTVEHIFSFGSAKLGDLTIIGVLGLRREVKLIASSARKDCRETVAATEFYPSVLDNLRANIDENFAGDPSDGDESLRRLAFDIMYEADHAIWIKKKCLERLLLRPMIPLRPTHLLEAGSRDHFPVDGHNTRGSSGTCNIYEGNRTLRDIRRWRRKEGL
ncbi:hypothetical protein EDD15DRAFT_2196781 [Pisolithus albus]|nr:hypothetical protein EDD15DRAFT_2196781 [Pisolithus albus]